MGSRKLDVRFNGIRLRFRRITETVISGYGVKKAFAFLCCYVITFPFNLCRTNYNVEELIRDRLLYFCIDKGMLRIIYFIFSPFLICRCG